MLVLNTGSSTLKFKVVDPDGTVWLARQVEHVDDDADRAHALDTLEDDLAGAGLGADRLLAVGHRIVHGGPDLVRPTILDDAAVSRIEDASELAPLHNPQALRALRRARERFPDLPHVAVFDTAFFADLPPAAATYALDAGIAERLRLRRYGMHGISHRYVAARGAELLGRDLAELRQVTLHLGNGASVAAVRGGRALDTSMGLTPLEGLVMGTRPGDLDPGVVVHLLRHGGLDVDGLEDLLHHRSGLLGLAGHSDFRDLVAARDMGDERARAAYDVYVHRLRKYVGAYVAVLGGLDVLTFTAGVGEHAAGLRHDVLTGLAPFGLAVDDARNAGDGARVISPDGAATTALVVPTDEELAIARDVAALIGS
ncbi:acetate/propionate family kinase [Nocardioides guangzhouensis]|uniref:Acetate kinase n=1 Tax=Nocardioides guangzhouensis TaxID=2497878 RepID=A0A4Q4ZH59_9ACTN|nr:acetate/propionate family kinase [Nocardioides guangzhouensis]